jgi:hypothetical protein
MAKPAIHNLHNRVGVLASAREQPRKILTRMRNCGYACNHDEF